MLYENGSFPLDRADLIPERIHCGDVRQLSGQSPFVAIELSHQKAEFLKVVNLQRCD
jgi:hypothetical protein